jgi:hypothetical protein
LNLRPPGPELSQCKLQVLYLVSLRNSKPIFLSLSCTELVPIYRLLLEMTTTGYDDNVEEVKKNMGKKNKRK